MSNVIQRNQFSKIRFANKIVAITLETAMNVSANGYDAGIEKSLGKSK